MKLEERGELSGCGGGGWHTASPRVPRPGFTLLSALGLGRRAQPLARPLSLLWNRHDQGGGQPGECVLVRLSVLMQVSGAARGRL